MIEENSVSIWISAVREGDSVAANALWSRYFEQLLQQARHRMSRLPRSVYDEEDAAISTFRVLCEKLREGAYPELAGRDEIWHLLLTMLVRKVNRRAEYEKAEKRQQPVGLTHEHADSIPCLKWNALTAQSAEDCRQLLSLLGDENLERVAIWKLEGFTNDEIATKLNRSRRTVQRMLGLIRETWSAGMPDDENTCN
ncbi:ECF sigma factor [Rubripirellula obstinata]|uniref:ECF sigma factor n=1 Tax=Rubripirellula obstinata TaxID=406547 RepID=A0A5B1CQ95_9BACT|nr:ECF-type sigma factor [Rubripirellula obstinata]KAA1262029.1 ECF sigma factor [Rubripirellula obstinata]